ncbi:translation initiation factor IF-2 isoform X2 [Leguminivora glycinivorella]|uniref:translation initiation factor IF-2 isoform X2 n=1 Tax=Leguminivora glycinivorella TaxID=1035111 RepID=UPI00200BD1BD|nr:translation initiation factor IF-2 isoform X2 [Leguminivora glycinivorella]
MKIPETSANVGAYYGNEENGQWQPNGVIIDSGVPGGVVGSGDGLHPQPVYPVHIPRGHHIPGYVMAGAYYAGGAGYAGAAPPDDFADYMWMENEEEFDKQVMQQLEEEALMEQCIEAMLEDEQREQLERHNPHYPTTSNGNPSLSLEETVSRSTLNPLAAEFVPTFVPRGARTEEKKAEVKSTEETQKEPSEGTEEAPQVTEEVKTEEPLPPVDPPEVSAADVQPIDKRRDSKKDSKTKPETKKPVKADPKKASKPAVVVKSETKVQPKKKEVKAVKSEPRLEEREKEDAPVVVAEVPKAAAPTPVAEPAGPKPINYAAAARAGKPRPAPASAAAPSAPAPAPAPAARPAQRKHK